MQGVVLELVTQHKHDLGVIVDTVSAAVRGSNGKRNRMVGCNHREHSSWVKRVDVIVKQEIVRPYLDYGVRFGNLI